jgi:hypothetical protein
MAHNGASKDEPISTLGLNPVTRVARGDARDKQMEALMAAPKMALMTTPRMIGQQMEVVGCDGGHVGTVDGLTDTEIRLAKNDPDAGGQEHYIPLAWLLHAEIKVHLNLPSAEAKSHWITH